MIVGHTDTSVGFSSTSFGAVPDNYSWSVASNFPQFKPNFTFWKDRSLFVFFGGKCVRNKIRENNSCVSALPGFKAEYICLKKMENSVGNDVRFLTSKWLPFAIPGYFQSPTKIHLLRKLQRIIEVDWSRFLANNLSDFWIHRLADKRSQSVQSTCYSDTIYHRLLKTHLLRSSAWFRKYHFSFKNSLFLLSTQDTRFRASR